MLSRVELDREDDYSYITEIFSPDSNIMPCPLYVAIREIAEEYGETLLVMVPSDVCSQMCPLYGVNTCILDIESSDDVIRSILDMTATVSDGTEEMAEILFEKLDERLEDANEYDHS